MKTFTTRNALSFLKAAPQPCLNQHKLQMARWQKLTLEPNSYHAQSACTRQDARLTSVQVICIDSITCDSSPPAVPLIARTRY